MVIRGTNGSHYGCSTYMQGGEAACSMGLHLSRRVAEEVVLGPIRSELLAPEAVDRFCGQIRAWALSESSRVEQGIDPAVAAIDAEISDIEALIEARPAVFAEGRKLYGRFGLDHAQLMRSSNPGFIESCGSGGLLRAL
jgi:hypothetical protein